MNKNNPITKKFIIVVATLLIALSICWITFAEPESTTQVKSTDPILAAIDHETAQLHVKPHSFLLPSDKAMACRLAIKHGDYATASKIAEQILGESKQDKWGFYPFNIFMEAFVYQKDNALLDNLNKWVEKDKTSAIAYLLRAHYYLYAGWDIRGGEFTSKTDEDRLALFSSYLRSALTDIERSKQLNPNNPFTYFKWLSILAADGNTPEVEKAFQESISRYPTYYPLYRKRLETLMPKWGGSPKEMLAFTEFYAGNTSDNSPLKFLYLNLYADFLNTAWITCQSHENNEIDTCVSQTMGTLVQSDFAKKVYAALDLFKTDTYQFGIEFKPLIDTMFKTPGGERFAGELLQFAASRIGVETQLVHNNIGHNNYVLDEITAKYWERQNIHENAEKKYKEALIDIEHTSFPSEREKNMALMNIYDELSDIYPEKEQYVQAIAYQNAAIAVGGENYNGYRYIKCFSYYKLKRFKEAVQECSDRITKGADIETYFWRGKSFNYLNQEDKALEDFNLVADSDDHHFRTSAAIEASVIYANRKDITTMLSSMNKHSYLFDEKNQDKKDLAISYNNRCFAYMQLGRLQEAFNDCNTSLIYGNLPDAYQKQQELLKKLGPIPTNQSQKQARPVTTSNKF